MGENEMFAAQEPEQEPIIYTLILSDGTRVENLTMNGSNFVSKTELTESMFEENLTPVIISDGIHMETHKAMEFIQIARYDDGWYLALIDISDSELALRKMNSNIQYLSMMTGIDLF